MFKSCHYSYSYKLLVPGIAACYYVFVYILPGKVVPEMTYTVLGGTLNATQSLTRSRR